MNVQHTKSGNPRWIIGGAIALACCLTGTAAQAAAPAATAKGGIIVVGGKAAPQMRLNPQPLPPRW